MTKPRSGFERRCRGRGSSPDGPGLRGLRGALGGSGGQAAIHAGRIRPPRLAPAGNAARDLTAHRDQRRIRLVSPNQLLKHYTDDYGWDLHWIWKYQAPHKVEQAPWQPGSTAKPRYGAQKPPAPYWAVIWGLPVNHPPGSYVPLEAAGGLG